MVAFAEVIDRLNDLFSDADMTAAQKESFLEGLLRTLLDDEKLVQQAAANSPHQFLESPDLTDAIQTAVAGNQDAHNTMANYFFADGPVAAELVTSIGVLVHMHAQENAGAT